MMMEMEEDGGMIDAGKTRTLNSSSSDGDT